MDIEFFRRVEVEGAVGGGGFVARVKYRDGGEFDPAVVESLDIDDGGQLVLALQVHIQPGQQRAMKDGDHAFVGAEDLLDQKIWIFLRLCERHDAGGEEVVAGELKGIENIESPEDIGHEAVAGFEIAKVVPQEDFVRALELAGSHRRVAFHDLGRAEEFASRGGGEFEAFGRLDFLELAEDLVAEGFFGVTEDIETSDPAKNRDADEKEDQNRPTKKPAVLAATGLGGIGVRVLKPSAAVFRFLVVWHLGVRCRSRRVRRKCRIRRSGRLGDF